MPVLHATVSSLPSPNIFKYQLVSISLMSVALCRCCATFFPEEELRLPSWELLRWALDPLREATDCFRSRWGGWCPALGPPTPPPLLRAASMAPEAARPPQGQSSGWRGAALALFQVSLCLLDWQFAHSQGKMLFPYSPVVSSLLFPTSGFYFSSVMLFQLSSVFLLLCLSVCSEFLSLLSVYLSFCLCSVLSGLL